MVPVSAPQKRYTNVVEQVSRHLLLEWTAANHVAWRRTLLQTTPFCEKHPNDQHREENKTIEEPGPFSPTTEFTLTPAAGSASPVYASRHRKWYYTSAKQSHIDVQKKSVTSFTMTLRCNLLGVNLSVSL